MSIPKRFVHGTKANLVFGPFPGGFWGKVLFCVYIPQYHN